MVTNEDGLTLSLDFSEGGMDDVSVDDDLENRNMMAKELILAS